MEEFIQRFLQLGKTNPSPARQSIDLAMLVEDLLPLVQPAARHAGVELVWRPGAKVDAIDGNRERLGQMIINLLVNAVEAAAQGHVRTGGRAEVRIELAQNEPHNVILTVSDTGPGPADDVQQTLFEPFVTEKPNGVGLGLSVTREIAEQHGGRVAWHRAERMTHFVVAIPAQQTEARCVESAGCR